MMAIKALYTFYPLLESAPLGLKAQGVQPRAVLMTTLQVSFHLFDLLLSLL